VDRRKLQSAMLVLTLLGALLMLPPLVSVFNQPISHWGVPQTVLYLFALWLLLIGGTALLNHYLPRDPSDSDGEAD
jgi:hypothetical protein